MAKKPYQQGDLDGLCGVYALVNAVDYLCGPLTKDEAQDLFEQILTYLESRAPLAQRCVEGIMINQIASILKDVICKQYPIQRYRPFHRQPRISKQRYLQTLRKFLRQSNTLVLVALEGHYSHWTLIRRITGRTLITYDSTHLRYLLKRSCSMFNRHVVKRHWLLPTQTYLLKSRLS